MATLQTMDTRRHDSAPRKLDSNETFHGSGPLVMTHAPTEFHSLETHEVVLLLETDAIDGLSGHEAEIRRAAVGPNVLPTVRRHGPVVRLALQFHSPLIYVLLVAGAASLFLDEPASALVIAAVVVLNAIAGFVQESKAGSALAALSSMTALQAAVIRDGTRRLIPAADLVPGDLVLLEAGDKVPADVRLMDSHQLRIDESALTGESVPAHKGSMVLADAASLGDRENMVHAGTLVTAGSGRGIVVATGADTEIGRIHRLIGNVTEVSTPLMRQMSSFSRWLTIGILFLAAGTLALGVAQGEPIGYMVTAAVALAVAMIPEGLPAAVTIAMAIGVARMARRNAIIRKLPATETLGSTTVICTDKTGTLTQNEMTVASVLTAGEKFSVTGTGYEPTGSFQRGSEPAIATPDNPLGRCLIAGALCNSAALLRQGDLWSPMGDPTEVALLVSAAKAGLPQEELRMTWLPESELPFDSKRQYMATALVGQGEIHASSRLVVAKGAVERVLGMCSSQLGADGQSQPLDTEGILRAAHEYGQHALRVLAFAEARHCEPVPESGLTEDWLKGLELVFLGLQAMSDPPRSEAITAVQRCQNAGIAVKMITGDHSATAMAIGAEIGLATRGGTHSVVTGAELDECEPSELPGLINSASVFARVSAEQKLNVVRALQAQGEVVAMTGDGVNDAPALKQADIGVAMGRSGTEVAKESADIVLTDDNFASIEAAVEEGRGAYANLQKFVTFTLPVNLTQGLVVLVAIVLASTLPMVPVQILWVNMTTALALGLMLAFEPVEVDVMDQPPRDPRQPMITVELLRRILLVGGILLIGTFALFELALAHGASSEAARTLAVNGLVLGEVAYLFSSRSLIQPAWRMSPLGNRFVLVGTAVMLVLQLGFTYWGPMNTLFQSAPLPASSWALALIPAAATFVVAELDKSISRQSRRRRLTHESTSPPGLSSRGPVR